MSAGGGGGGEKPTTMTTPPSSSFTDVMKITDNYGEFEEGEGENSKEETEKGLTVEEEAGAVGWGVIISRKKNR